MGDIIDELRLINNDIVDSYESKEQALEESREDRSGDHKVKIKQAIEKIDEFYELFKEWGIEEILNWSRDHKGRLGKEDINEICEAIAVMERANEIATSGHRLRETQKATI